MMIRSDNDAPPIRPESETSHDPVFREFKEIFFGALLSEGSVQRRTNRVESLVTHAFYLRLQRACLNRQSSDSSIDRLMLLREAQSLFAIQLLTLPMLGMRLPEDGARLAGFVRNAARNIAAKLLRSYRRFGVALDLVGQSSMGHEAKALASQSSNDQEFLECYREQCLAGMEEGEQLVSCFRWFLGWSIPMIAKVTGLTEAQVKFREQRAMDRSRRWISALYETRA